MPTETLTLRPDVVATVIESGAVLLDLETKYFYSVNLPGWAIVQMLESGATINQIEEQCKVWGASAEDSEAINDFIKMFVADKLVIDGQQAGEHGPILYEDVWAPPVIEKHKEPLQKIMVSAFDPTLPLME